jgi:DNA-binding transcriptional regulator YiaG
MSTLLDKPHMPPGSVTDARRPNIIFTRILTAPRSTTTSKEILDQNLTAASEMTTSGIAIASTNSPEATQKALGELRRLSGLTWEQLAKLFNVSRRSLHFWASGQPLSRFNEEHLNRLLGTIRYVDRGSANRSLLLRPDGNGNPLFGLLVAGKYEEFKRIVGSNNAPRKPLLGALSEDAHTAYMPQSPADLVDALQEPIHREVGRSRPARTARRRKSSSGQ